MKRMSLSTLGFLALFGCGSAPRVEVGPTSPVAVSEDLPRPAASPEVPRATFEAMQLCADQHAPKLPGESFAVMYDVEVTNDGNTVKVKDSMLGGSALERCLATALEQMDASIAANFHPNVTPHSRSMVGVVQTAAAPIVLGPIFLAAAGVSILVGVTIYVASEITNERERCKQVKEACIDQCSDGFMPSGQPDGMPYHECLRKCLEARGCWKIFDRPGTRF